MRDYEKLLQQNLSWIVEKLSLEKNYFKTLSEGQNPPFLYIGCSDSRIPIDTFTQSEPGNFFIHRNIANQVQGNDMNFLSTFEYAVNQLEVEHIIISGHYDCGGIKTAHETCELSPVVSNWLLPIKKIELAHREELDLIEDEEKRLDRLTELNVLEQIKHIFGLPIIRNKIASGKYPKVHGWVLDIKHGKIIELKYPVDEWKKNRIIPEEYIP